MKISELAKKLKISPKELLIQIVKLGVPVKSTQASLSDEALKRVIESLQKKNPNIKLEGLEKADSAVKMKKPKAPKKGIKEKKAKVIKAQTSKKPLAKAKPKPGKHQRGTEAAPAAKIEDVSVKTAGVSIEPTEKLTPKTTKIKKEIIEEKKVSAGVKETVQAAPRVKKETVSVQGAVSEESLVIKETSQTVLKELQVKFPVSVKELAEKMSVGASNVIRTLMDIKILATINQLIDESVCKEVALKFGYELKRLPSIEEEMIASHEKEEDDIKNLLPRPAVVTFMGHVDHGKTSLLDYIRKSKVANQEKGGITQHIGAYAVTLARGKITFLDTPGHEAFTAMRARGVTATDLVVLVVAADDGIMPQTIEALDHAQAAEVPIIVAINKIDKPDIDIDRLKKQLSEIGLLAEDWGGKTVTVNVSAKTGQGVDELLEMILLEAELLELKANPNRPAAGVVVESKLSKGSGPIATVLVQKGTLRQGDLIIAGQYYGKIKALINDKIQRVTEAGPSMPVEVLGLNGTPVAGDTFMMVEDEKKAKEVCDIRRQRLQEEKAAPTAHKITLENLYSEIQKGKIKELKVILKADVSGSLGAMTDSLMKLSTNDISLRIIHKAIGEINESDILLAAASNAIVMGFGVRKTPEADNAVKAEQVDIRLYSIIYEAISDIKAAMEGMLEPHIKEVFLGRAIVRQIFKITKAGTIAGSFVQKGKIVRGTTCRLVRDGEEIYRGRFSSLKRFKDDVREVAEGAECGIGLENFNDIKAGDIIEVFAEEKIARKL